ncbi:MAG: squalene--hopene cyclase, partial [Polyangiaceae bacterium]
MRSLGDQNAIVPPGDSEHIPLLPAPGRARIDASIARARDWLFGCQSSAGSWCAQLEGDTTLESYWILIDRFMERRNVARVSELAQTIRAHMLRDGGWAQYPGGPPELSVSCLSYFALKLSGVPESDPDLQLCRDVIVTLGGAELSNSYTKYHLALFGQYPWSRVPAIPPEMVLL